MVLIKVSLIAESYCDLYPRKFVVPYMLYQFLALIAESKRNLSSRDISIEMYLHADTFSSQSKKMHVTVHHS